MVTINKASRDLFVDQLGHYLTHFANLASSSVQGLIVARERANQLEYMLEQEMAINDELAKEVDCYKEALQKVQERINRLNDAITKAEAQIKNLE